MRTDIKAVIDQITRQATDQGSVIEAGWLSLRAMAIPATASDIQVSEMRKAFFAGAQHLYASIMSILEPGAEPTEKDMKRMELIDAELRAFVEEIKASIGN